MALDRAGDGTIAIVERLAADGNTELAAPPAIDKLPEGATVLFHALPADKVEGSKTTAPLYVWTHVSNGRRQLTVGDDSPGKDYQRAETPICRVWRYPLSSSIRFE
jgi:hypothetical protein